MINDNIVLSVENLSKVYQLGTFDSKSFYADIKQRVSPIRANGDLSDKLVEEDRYGGYSSYIRALNNISFQVKAGEVLGILGSNGAGKSTLLKIISRVTAPTEGIVRIRGNVTSLLEVGAGFHSDFSGKENIFMNGSILGMSKGKVNEAYDEIVEFSGIERFVDTPVKRYSSGMYVRLAFAVASHLISDIVVIDEVLAVGDQTFRKKSLEKMAEIAQSGRTVLFVSHNMDNIRYLCDRSIWLNKGNLLIHGDTEHVVDRYLKKT